MREHVERVVPVEIVAVGWTATETDACRSVRPAQAEIESVPSQPSVYKREHTAVTESSGVRQGEREV
jgi:hypothetical protein